MPTQKKQILMVASAARRSEKRRSHSYNRDMRNFWSAAAWRSFGSRNPLIN